MALQVMYDPEGVIKYQLDFESAPALDERKISMLNNWRTLLHQMDLIGQDDGRYGGLGYGNISERFSTFDGKPTQEFVISGTQTGHVHHLDESGYVLVLECDPAKNYMMAKGPIKPSSEAMTHATLYQLSETVGAVIHVHSPVIWRCADQLRIAVTGANVPYGTPEMSLAIQALYQSGAFSKQKVFAMLGHEDGVVSFGHDIENAGQELIKILAMAIQNFK